jgi:hypothetical protein
MELYVKLISFLHLELAALSGPRVRLSGIEN